MKKLLGKYLQEYRNVGYVRVFNYELTGNTCFVLFEINGKEEQEVVSIWSLIEFLSVRVQL